MTHLFFLKGKYYEKFDYPVRMFWVDLFFIY